jgi:lysophospholipase L1-like esterase
LVRQLASHYTLDWLLIAQTGATTASTLARLHQTPAQPFDIAVVALGVNDVTRATPLRRWLAQQAMLNNLLGDKFAVRRIYTSGLPPMSQFPVLPNPLRWLIGQTASRFDRAITHARARDPRITQIALDLPLDAHLMAADGFHPGEQVYAIWAEKLSSAIRSDFAQESGGNHAP